MAEKKLQSNLRNMLLVLTTISAVSALALAFTYTKTKDAIALVQAQKKLMAIQNVAPGFDNNPDQEKYTVKNFEGIELYPAKQEGRLKGIAVKTFSSAGYGGDIWLMVGFDHQGIIYDIAVLKHQETPGLGSKMEAAKFKNQFKGQSPASFKLLVKKDGGDVDAITAATITSRAFCSAVGKAYEAYSQGGIR